MTLTYRKCLCLLGLFLFFCKTLLKEPREALSAMQGWLLQVLEDEPSVVTDYS